MERVTFISTVSGGSLVTGLIYSLAGGRWPTSQAYLDDVLPKARALLTHTDIQREMLLRFAARPRLWARGRAQALADAMRVRWGIRALLGDLPRSPRWIINATAFESGKNWRFMPQRMGDYLLGYVPEPRFPLAEAMAASAAFPGLIGPLVIDTHEYAWAHFADGQTRTMQPQEPPVRRVHLWDGGVYDNLGVEALFKPRGDRFREGFEFLIVSDASGSLEIAQPRLFKRTMRLIAIATEQVRGLRARSLIDHFHQKPGTGVYLRIGKAAAQIYAEAGVPPEVIPPLLEDCLSDDDVRLAAGFATTLRRVSADEFARICRHGWEVADCTMRAYGPHARRRASS